MLNVLERQSNRSMFVRRLSIDDLPLRVEWMNNPKVYQSMHFDLPVLLERTIAWFENNKSKDTRADLAFCSEDGEVLAFGGITGISKDLKKGELYLFVNPDSQSKGIGTMAMKLMCKYGFSELGLNKVYLETNEDNFIGIHVYEKLGFILEGRLRQEYLASSGELKDRLYYGMLNSEYTDGE